MIVVLMGVSGAGKTLIGKRLAERLDWSFHESDDYHSAEDVAKMANGIPLTDADRQPWLDRLNALLRRLAARDESAVLACSALKADYRRRLARSVPPEQIRFVYLKGSYELIRRRMEARENHYMKADMLRSQFEALEEPTSEEDILIVDVEQPPEEIVAQLAAVFAPEPECS
jgi:gluconokinase